MGFIFSKISELISGKQKLSAVLYGLESSGKTVILYRIKLGDLVKPIPTIGFNVETFEYGDFNFTLWDVGGQEAIKKLWPHFYRAASKCIIFVVDSADRERIYNAKEELFKLSNDVKDAIILVLANKQDLEKCMSVEEVTHRLGLPQLENRKWKVIGTSAMEGFGFNEGLEWIAKSLYKKPLMQRIKDLCKRHAD